MPTSGEAKPDPKARALKIGRPRRDPVTCRIFCAELTDAEYSYAIQRGGEGFFERAYGVRYAR